jgi:hypothetical protein
MTPPPAAASPFRPPAGITALGPDVADRVRELVAAAERRQDAEVEAALQDGLRTIPRPLRGVARKVLVG